MQYLRDNIGVLIAAWFCLSLIVMVIADSIFNLKRWVTLLACLGVGLLTCAVLLSVERLGGSPAPAVLLISVVNILILLLLSFDCRRREWDSHRFLYLAIWVVSCSAVFYASFHLLVPAASQSVVAHSPDAPFLDGFSRFVSAFVNGAAALSWTWTIFGVWLSIHISRARQGQMMNYDAVLGEIADMLERSTTRVHEAQKDRMPIDEKDRAADQRRVRMVLFTPSNGNVSCASPDAYNRYREKLVVYAKTAQRGAAALTVVCLSEEAVKRYYKAYAGVLIDEDFAKTACLEALDLYGELRKYSNGGARGIDGKGLFQLVTTDNIDDLFPHHLVCAASEAWLWAPHGDKPVRQMLAPEGFTDADLGAVRDSTMVRGTWLKEAQSRRQGGLECVAFRTEDVSVRAAIERWISGAIERVRGAQHGGGAG